MSKEVQDLLTEVTRTKGVQASAVAFIQGLIPILTDAAGDRTASLAAIEELKTSTDAVAAAIATNP